MSAYAKIRRVTWSSDWVVHDKETRVGTYVVTWTHDDVLVRRDSVAFVTEDVIYVNDDKNALAEGKHTFRTVRFIGDDLYFYTDLTFDEIEDMLNG